MTRVTLAMLLAMARPGFCDLSNYLPLNVGNAWYYSHHHFDIVGHTGSLADVQVKSDDVTFSILRTEVIDGKTYHVFSDAPGTIPPAHSLFGKRVRWEGDSLMVYDGTSSEYPLFRFYGGSQDEGEIVEDTYSLDSSKADDDTEARRLSFLGPAGVQRAAFWFYGSSHKGIGHPEYVRYVTFLRGFGMTLCTNFVEHTGADYSSYENQLGVERARLLVQPSGAGEGTASTGSSASADQYREVSYYDAARGIGLLPPQETSIPLSSWGKIKGENPDELTVGCSSFDSPVREKPEEDFHAQLY